MLLKIIIDFTNSARFIIKANKPGLFEYDRIHRVQINSSHQFTIRRVIYC